MSGPDRSRGLASPEDLDAVAFREGDGLVPVVAQDARTGTVLMLAWADRRALERALATGEMHYWSRSRKELWRKGETSGNVQRIRELRLDCDGDAVLARVEPAGPACHTGRRSCFGGEGGDGLEVLGDLWRVLEARDRERPRGSWTARLLEDEGLRLEKLGEESGELVVALREEGRDRAVEEAADLVYHVLVALLAEGATLDELLAELARRRR